MEKLKINMFIEDDKEILAKMKKAYLACPAAVKYVRELGIPEEKIDANITKVYDFVSDINYCRNCPGLAKCEKANPTLCTKIIYQNGVVDRQLNPCPKFLDKIMFDKRFQIRDFDERLLDAKVSDLDQTQAKGEALTKFLKYTKNESNSWIYITGGPNSGRSFLATVIATEAARKGYSPINFINCSTRIRQLFDLSMMKDKTGFQLELDRLCNCRVLVLDDFGNEYKSDFVRDAIVFQILSTRANKKLFTIVTSDFPIDDIVTLYSTSKAGEIRAKQIGKILKAVCEDEISLGDLSIY